MIHDYTPRDRQPVDVLVHAVPAQDAAGFVATCMDVAKFVREGQPDVVMFPNRGASPMLHVIQGSDALVDYVFIEPPIGSAVGSRKTGITVPEKREILEDYVYPGQLVAIVDESQQGGTMKAHSKLTRLITEQPVIACQVQDQRMKPQFSVAHRDNSAIFVGPVFHIDRNVFLDEIVQTDTARHIDRNVPANLLFGTLGQSVHGPISAEQLVGDQHPEIVSAEQIVAWVTEFNAQGLSI